MGIAGIAAVVFAIASIGVIAFQIALALGAPWGAYAMGGAYPGRFPGRLRVAALIQSIVIAALAVIVLSDADLVVQGLTDGLPWLTWIAVGFSAVTVVLNSITRSAVERRTWLPVGLVLLMTSAVAALA
jgi:hypothetical protein